MAIANTNHRCRSPARGVKGEVHADGPPALTFWKAAGDAKLMRRLQFRQPGRRSGWGRILAVAVLALVCTGLQAAPADRLRAAIASRDWPAAEAELALLASASEADPVEVLFLQGMMALEQRRLDAAIEAFRAILALRPELVRVRLELARALFLNGDDEAARFHFERVLAAQVPQTVANNVRHFLQLIRARRNWSLDVFAGLLSDSNVNGGSRLNTVMLGGLPFTLNEDARQTSGRGVAFGASGQWRSRNGGDTRLLTWGSLLRRDFSDSRFDDTVARAGVGPVWLARDGEVSLTPMVAYREYGNEGYSHAYGVRAEANWRLDDRWTVTAAGERQRQSNHRDAGRSGNLTWLGGRAYYTLNAASALSFGVDHQREQPRDSPLAAHAQTGVLLGHHMDWRGGMSHSLVLELLRTDYDRIQPLFNIRRRDHAAGITLSLSRRDIDWQGFRPVLSLSRFSNDSSIDFYAYRRTTVQLYGDRRF